MVLFSYSCWQSQYRALTLDTGGVTCVLPMMWTHSPDPLLILQQQNFKQKVVALLRRFKVSDEVSGQLNEVLCLGCPWHVALVFSF